MRISGNLYIWWYKEGQQLVPMAHMRSQNFIKSKNQTKALEKSVSEGLMWTRLLLL